MKTKKSAVSAQRRLLDEKLQGLLVLRTSAMPRSGWLKAIRGALGLSARGLASRLNVPMSNVLKMEEREVQRTISLEILDRAAQQMDCRLVYALVPKVGFDSLEAIIEARAESLAKEVVSSIAHSMNLEEQGLGEKKNSAQIERLKDEFIKALEPRLWKKP